MDELKQPKLPRKTRWIEELHNLAGSCLLGTIGLLGIAVAGFLFITFLPELVELLQSVLEPVLRALGAFLAEIIDRWQ